MSFRPLGLTAGLLLLAGLLLPPPALGKIDEAAWKAARKEALELMKMEGQRYTKLKAIEVLAQDDSIRAAELLVKWTLGSLKLQKSKLAKGAAKTRAAFEKIDAQMRKTYEKVPPRIWSDGKHKEAWAGAKYHAEHAQRLVDIERAVRFGIGDVLRHFADSYAVSYLIDKGLPTIRKAKDAEPELVLIARGLFQQPKERMLRTALVLARDAEYPKLRILAINWFGQHQVKEGRGLAEKALKAREVAVRRAAVMALTALDDKRSVKPLIEAMQGAEGQLRVEIDDALYHFTGQAFEGDAAVWKRWWAEQGKTWFGADTGERFHRKREELPGGTRVRFYGIPTESHHVVFVLDRSGSMKEPAGAKSKPKPKRGPVTGDPEEGKGKPKAGPVEGNTKIEVAKNQLARSIDQLDKQVEFNMVFYSSDVKTWQEPPALLTSTKANKEDAKKWFMALDAVGPTLLFPALMKALEYSDTIRKGQKKPRTGADTIFLLSDGSPTTADGKILHKDEFEEQYRRFLEANEIYHCVVHTIGVGPKHNKTLMKRIARDTGGKYKAVGAE